MKRNFRGMYIALLVLLGVPALSFGQSLDQLLDHLSRDQRRQLLSTGVVEQYLENHRRLAFVPDFPLAEGIVASIDHIRPNVLSEQLVLVRGDVDRDDLLDLFNSLRRVSDLSYLEYYNERTESTNDLFRDSFAVAGRDDRRRIPDPEVTRIPASDEIAVLQGLPPFGTVLSTYRYRSDGSAFLFSGTNHDSLEYRGIRVVQDGNMITHMLVIPGDDFVLMYGVGGVRAFKMFGFLDDRIEAAFSGRTEGLFDWYRETYLSRIAD